MSAPKAPVQGDLWNRSALASFADKEDSPLEAERAYARGLEAIRRARALGLPPRHRLRHALEAARVHLLKCSEERADSIRGLLRSHALQGRGLR